MRYSDLKLLGDIHYFDGKDVYIYGTGDYGVRTARMLDKTGVFDYTFCNSNRAREGTKKLGNRIVHPTNIPDRASSVAIIAVSPQNKQYIEEMERELSGLSDIDTISYFALELFCTIFGMSREGDLERLIDQSIDESTWPVWLMEGARSAIAADILVFQPGKVASTSVYEGLLQLGLHAAHIHAFTRWVPLEKRQGYEELLRGSMRGKKFITLIREPISRQVSLFFEMLCGELVFLNRLLRRNIAAIGFQNALRGSMLSKRDHLETWFENEFLPITGINVFLHPFDTEKGYTIIRENGIEVLLVTMEHLFSLEGVIGEFIGNSDFKLRKENVAAEKDYAKLYQETLDTVKIPRAFYDQYYKNSSFMKHFYSQADIERFAARWRSHVKD